ncbi:glycine betaine/L-proline transporter ProP [Frateuria aurantia]|uniref:Arabinose efflux permease family protein n=1 Tax=Frateuria aurantia (strain ATCC 33424 / DSM 6220 / KCTC 2777 / LMG 1558 / NBRC 3245 / NCIMB 13370) TaxID=767434 RepID=H8KZQ1_FRAAD|nr:glycine betaine/L-proline transporter ProP [Frateuria aurantia]AFC84562.1 arabinose efflux permease family protein [Frateuria aurantia DSM 6220]
MRNTSLSRRHFGWFKSRDQKVAVDDLTIVDQSLLHRAVAATALGNAMEWFDFGVYSYIAVTLGKVFFPAGSSVVQTLASLATFAVGFLIRPVGGLVFGPLGDKFGRKRILALTMIMMAASTFSIAFIPSYASIGIAAPILLMLARLLQGFSTGGEYGGAATFIAEYSTDRRRGFMGSWLEFGTMVGYIGGACIVTLLTSTLSSESLLSWGWRVPFLIAGPLGLMGLYMRLKLEESPAFQAYSDSVEHEEHEKPAYGLGSLIRIHGRQLLKAVGLVLVFNVTDYMLLSYLPSYMTSVLNYSETRGLWMVLLVMVLMLPCNVLGGLMSDRFGRKPMILTASLAMVVLAIPCIKLIGSGMDLEIFIGFMLLALCLVAYTSSMPSTLPALFYTPVRYSALSIAFNVSVSLFGGTTPLATAWLIEKTHNTMVPAYYLMVAGVIGVITILCVRETAGRPLRGSPPAVGSRSEAREVLAGDDPLTVDSTLPRI